MYHDLYNARAQPVFSSLNLLFGDVAVAVAVVVFLNSLICHENGAFRSRVDGTQFENGAFSKTMASR